MNPPTLKPVIVPGYENESPAPSLRSVVRKSATSQPGDHSDLLPGPGLCRGTESRRPDAGNHGGDQRFDLDRHVHTVLIRFACPDLLDAGLFCGTA